MTGLPKITIAILLECNCSSERPIGAVHKPIISKRKDIASRAKKASAVLNNGRVVDTNSRAVDGLNSRCAPGDQHIIQINHCGAGAAIHPNVREGRRQAIIANSRVANHNHAAGCDRKAAIVFAEISVLLIVTRAEIAADAGATTIPLEAEPVTWVFEIKTCTGLEVGSTLMARGLKPKNLQWPIMTLPAEKTATPFSPWPAIPSKSRPRSRTTSLEPAETLIPFVPVTKTPDTTGVPSIVIALVIVRAPNPPGSRTSISPPANVLEIAPANVLHGAVRLHGFASSPTPDTHVRVACPYKLAAISDSNMIFAVFINKRRE